MRGLVSKRMRCFSPSAFVEAMGMFEYADSPAGINTSSANVALADGSSHIGAKRRPSDTSNCVASMRRDPAAVS
jgi:hypothetical protein